MFGTVHITVCKWSSGIFFTLKTDFELIMTMHFDCLWLVLFWQEYDGLFGFTLSTWGQTKIYITILFKKIKDFLIFRTIGSNFFGVFAGPKYKFVRGKIMDFFPGEHLDRSFLI
jgi:hypothetical protein